MPLRHRNGQLSWSGWAGSAVAGKMQEESWFGCRTGEAQELQEWLGRREKMARETLPSMASLSGEQHVCFQWKIWTVLLFCLFSAGPACFDLSDWKGDIGNKSFLMIRAGVYAACSLTDQNRKHLPAALLLSPALCFEGVLLFDHLSPGYHQVKIISLSPLFLSSQGGLHTDWRSAKQREGA